MGEIAVLSFFSIPPGVHQGKSKDLSTSDGQFIEGEQRRGLPDKGDVKGPAASRLGKPFRSDLPT